VFATFLRERRIAAVINATHPFAATMGRNAAAAGREVGVPLLRLERPAWRPGPGDRLPGFGEWAGAVQLATGEARHVLLAIGRRELDAFATLDHVWFLIRSVKAPDPMRPFLQGELLLARGPFDLASERTQLTERRIDTIVCRNSGGAAAEAKLVAARALGLRVVIKRRSTGQKVPAVSSVPEALKLAICSLIAVHRHTSGACKPMPAGRPRERPGGRRTDMTMVRMSISACGNSAIGPPSRFDRNARHSEQ
jgi:precorrin-6A/cobalt-precorrin-6A reductase